MNHRPTPYLLAAIVLGILVAPAYAQFGKNKVNYKNFKWSYIQSKHFDVYTYEGGDDIAAFTADVAEETLLELQSTLGYRLRHRVPLLIYNSHNDFQQTNAIGSYMPEGVGGVTELFKNRVALPYEGNYEKFRHVIQHELSHALINDMLYGEAFPNKIYAAMAFSLPLWVNEGLAEYNSTGWDTDSDMWMRDAAINNYLDFASPYWGGNSIWNFVAEKFGKEKVGEVIQRMRQTTSVDDGLKRALGIDTEELTEQWQLWSKRRYWPDLADRKRPDEIAKQLTDHEEGDGGLNLSPTISPNGDKIAFFSTRSQYYDLYIMSAIDGKVLSRIVEGNRSPDFEELHIIGPLNFATPALTWSPDGRKLAFASKTGEYDALFIIDVKTKKHTRYNFNLDGIWSPAWSPNGIDIAFVAAKDGYSDIYLLNVETGDLRNITDDPFSDAEPSWSPDGNRIAFTSDRQDYITRDMIPADFKMQDFDFYHQDIYIMDADGSNMERITDTPWVEGSPVWYPDGKGLAMVSQEVGISNIYLMDFEDMQPRPISNLITGAILLSFSKDGSKLAFSSLFNRGFNIYLMKNPFEIDSDEIVLKETVFFQQKREADILAKEREANRQALLDEANTVLAEGESLTQPPAAQSDDASATDAPAEGTVINPNERQEAGDDDFASYVFNRDDRDDASDADPLDTNAQDDLRESLKNFTLRDSEMRNTDGTYRRKRYKLRFTPDAIVGGAGFDTYFGVQGQTAINFSDLMGNHNITLGSNLFGDLRNSSFMAVYSYLPRKTNYHFIASHQALYFGRSFSLLGQPVSRDFRLRQIQFGVFMERPLNRFTRFEYGLTYNRLSQTFFTDTGGFGIPITASGPEATVHYIRPEVAYVKDTTLPPNGVVGPLGPLDGTAMRLTLRYSPPLGQRFDANQQLGTESQSAGVGFTTVLADMRKYYKMGSNYSFAFRLSGGASFGRDPEGFYLGGIDNWLNREFNGNIRDDLDDIFFGSFVGPLRGLDYYGLVGDRYALLNTEFRFPLIQFIALGFPLPIAVQNIRGAGFLDVGSAWVGNDWHLQTPAADDPDGKRFFDDFGYGFGLGVRALFFLPIRWDIAWHHDGQKVVGPRYLWSFGLEW